MPDWLERLLVAGGGLTMLGALVKGWWTARREDRDKRDKAAAEEKEKEEKRRQDEIDRLRAENKEAWERVDAYQKRFESLLMDAAAKAEDDKREKAERLAMDAKQLDMLGAATAALKESTVVIARIEKGAA